MKNVILVIAIILLTILGNGCVQQPVDDHHEPVDLTYNVKYSVTGTASHVFITYENSSGGTSQEDTTSPWSYTFTAEIGFWTYLSAQNQDDCGSVIVTIYRDGEVFKTSTSNGGYVIATVDGEL